LLLFGTVGFWAAASPSPPRPPCLRHPAGCPGVRTPGTLPSGRPPARSVPRFSHATDVARDFAARALGISDPTVDEPPSVNGSGIGTVTISPFRRESVGRSRPTSGRRQLGDPPGGDQSRLEGITMLPGGKPGPVMTIHPPRCDSADVTEVAADGTYEIHLTAPTFERAWRTWSPAKICRSFSERRSTPSSSCTATAEQCGRRSRRRVRLIFDTDHGLTELSPSARPIGRVCRSWRFRTSRARSTARHRRPRRHGGRDDEGVHRTGISLRAVVHLHVEMTGDDVAGVGRFTGVGARQRLTSFDTSTPG